MYTRTKTVTDTILDEVRNERVRQVRKHGHQHHLPDGTGPERSILKDVDAIATDALWELDNADMADYAKARCKAASENEGGDGTITFEHILTEEFFEAMAEEDKDKLYDELIQVTAVGVQWLEKLHQEGRRR